MGVESMKKLTIRFFAFLILLVFTFVCCRKEGGGGFLVAVDFSLIYFVFFRCPFSLLAFPI